MSDYDDLFDLLTRFGVEFEELTEKNLSDMHTRAAAAEKMILCSEGATLITGYCDFYTIFRFDCDGNFIDMGAYE